MKCFTACWCVCGTSERPSVLQRHINDVLGKAQACTVQDVNIRTATFKVTDPPKESLKSSDENNIIDANSASLTQASTLTGELCVYSTDLCHLCLISRQRVAFALLWEIKKKPKTYHLKTVQWLFRWPDRPYTSATYTQRSELHLSKNPNYA